MGWGITKNGCSRGCLSHTSNGFLHTACWSCWVWYWSRFRSRFSSCASWYKRDGRHSCGAPLVRTSRLNHSYNGADGCSLPHLLCACVFGHTSFPVHTNSCRLEFQTAHISQLSLFPQPHIHLHWSLELDHKHHHRHSLRRHPDSSRTKAKSQQAHQDHPHRRPLSRLRRLRCRHNQGPLTSHRHVDAGRCFREQLPDLVHA